MIFTGGCFFRSSINTSSPSFSGITMSVINRSAGVLEQRQPFRAVARFDHGVAKMGEGQAQHGADGVVVVDEEDSSHDSVGGSGGTAGPIAGPGCRS